MSIRVILRRPFTVLLASLLAATPGRAQVSANTAALSFDLSDQFGTRWRSEQLAGRALVLVLGARAHSERMKSWSDSLQRSFSGDTAMVRWFMVADLRRVPSYMRRFASQRAPREAHRLLLMDGAGTVAQQLGADRNAMTVLVLDRDHRVMLQRVDVSPTPDQLQLVRATVLGR